MRAALVAAAALLAAGAYRLAKAAPAEVDGDSPGGWLADADQLLGSATDYMGGIVGNRMSGVDSALSHPNVRAFLRVIRVGEGTADDGGYSRLFGGAQFASFDDHPRVKTYEKRDEFVRNGKLDYTTAAGAYQAVASTWDETRAVAPRLPDFSPASQDLFAVRRLAYRGALRDVIAGNFTAAIAATAREWASLPGSPYGQPTISMSKAAQVFEAAGGNAIA